ncbi:MAG: mannitol dehydrogenase family protein [Paracoccaceae bacterium]
MTTRPNPGIVHLGIGAFFRAFGLPWLEDAMADSGGDWGVIGVSLRSASVRDALAPQSFRYPCVEMGPEGRSIRTINALRDVLVAPDDPAAVLSHMADPATQIISLTVTEKGYCHDPATGRLNRAHPEIVRDLNEPLPRTAPGYILRALQMRHAAGASAPTILSCDNLPGNGSLLRGILLDLAAEVDTDIRDWIAANVTFPNTMVDRIVPATTADDIAAHPSHDPGLVLHEPFRQWVIEDAFAGPRPALENVGVQLVQDVAPFEEMKLRMLNGTHSAIAYLGYLAGHETVAEAMTDTAFPRFLRHLWRNEIIPTLSQPEGADLAEYAEALLTRFANPGLKHRTWQIAMDGSQKLPQRILGTLQDQLDRGENTAGLLLTVAGWMRYVSGTDEAGNPIDVRDPLVDHLQDQFRAASTPEARVAALLSVEVIFDPILADRIKGPLTEVYKSLLAEGARGMVERTAQ